MQSDYNEWAASLYVKKKNALRKMCCVLEVSRISMQRSQ